MKIRCGISRLEAHWRTMWSTACAGVRWVTSNSGGHRRPIDRLALCQEGFDFRQSTAQAGKVGPVIGSGGVGGDPAEQFRRDRNGDKSWMFGIGNGLAIFGRSRGAAAQRDDMIVQRRHFADNLRFQQSKPGFTVVGENLADGFAGPLHDQHVAIDKGTLQSLGQESTHRRLRRCRDSRSERCSYS